MNYFRKQAAQWLDLSNKARAFAAEEDYLHKINALKIADLCEHIAAAMERISDIMTSEDMCTCGQCPTSTPNILQ